MKTAALALSVIVGFLFAGSAVADLYKWVDEDGVTHFSDTPPSTEREVETLDTPEKPISPPEAPSGNPDVSPAPPGPATAPRKARNPQLRPKAVPRSVDIYVTDWCPYCRKAIAFLRSNGVAFRAYDIEKDARAHRRMRALGGTGGVPFAVINGRKIQGYSEGAYRKALGLP